MDMVSLDEETLVDVRSISYNSRTQIRTELCKRMRYSKFSSPTPGYQHRYRMSVASTELAP